MLDEHWIANYLISTFPESHITPSHLTQVTTCRSELEEPLRCILWHLSVLPRPGVLVYGTKVDFVLRDDAWVDFNGRRSSVDLLS